MPTTSDEKLLTPNETEKLKDSADKYFVQISEDLSNAELLAKTLQLEGLSVFVVSRLEMVERDDTVFWEDEVLLSGVRAMIEKGQLTMPKDLVDEQRWLALLCIASSVKEGFSYGNVVIVPDYLPDDSEEFREYEALYGYDVMEGILARREVIRSSSR